MCHMIISGFLLYYASNFEKIIRIKQRNTVNIPVKCVRLLRSANNNLKKSSTYVLVPWPAHNDFRFPCPLQKPVQPEIEEIGIQLSLNLREKYFRVEELYITRNSD